MKNLIFIGGIYHAGFAVFHLLFWKIFSWRENLKPLNIINRGVIQILNLRLIYIFLVIAFLSFFFNAALLSSKLGNAILIGISMFWLMRAVEQIIFFGWRKKASALIFLIFLLGAVIYICPVLF